MTIVAGDVLRCTIDFVLGDGSHVQNIFHHKRVGLGIITDATHLAAYVTWAQNMYGEIANMVKNDVLEQLAFLDRVAWNVDRWEVVENIGTFTWDFVPSGTGEMLPNMDSAFVIFKTARPKTIGRKFLLPFEELWQAGTFLLAGAVTDLVAWADDAVNNLVVSAPLDYMVPGVPRTGVDAWYPFTVAIVTNVLGTQRRRRPGVGA